MADLQLNNQTSNTYAFGPYVLGPSPASVTIDTTTNASLYLTDDHFADIVNQLLALGFVTYTPGTQPTPFPRVTGVPQILHGDGSPEGVVFATQGSAFMRRDNSGAGNALYAKTTGPSLSTGWQAFSGSTAPTAATTLPGSPSNGQQAILVDSTSAPTYAWFFQYSSAASKWLFVGGSPAVVINNGSLSTTSTSFVDVGATFTTPRAGDYIVEVTAFGNESTGAGAPQAQLRMVVAATNYTTMNGIVNVTGTVNRISVAGKVKATGVAASAVVKLQGLTTVAATASWDQVLLAVTPVAVT
jgi:hypothetical protein